MRRWRCVAMSVILAAAATNCGLERVLTRIEHGARTHIDLTVADTLDPIAAINAYCHQIEARLPDQSHSRKSHSDCCDALVSGVLDWASGMLESEAPHDEHVCAQTHACTYICTDARTHPRTHNHVRMQIRALAIHAEASIHGFSSVKALILMPHVLWTVLALCRHMKTCRIAMMREKSA